jgi:hypothetical protein
VPKLKFTEEPPSKKEEKFANFTKITARKSYREGEEPIVLDPQEEEESKLRKSIAAAVIQKKKYKDVRTTTAQGRTYQRKQQQPQPQNQTRNELYEKVPGLVNFGFDQESQGEEEPDPVEVDEDLLLSDDALLQKYMSRGEEDQAGSAEAGRPRPLDRSAALHSSNRHSFSRQELTSARKIKQVVQYLVASASPSIKSSSRSRSSSTSLSCRPRSRPRRKRSQESGRPTICLQS